MTLTGKHKEVLSQLRAATQPELMQLLTSLVGELNKLYLVHGLDKLKQTSLIKKNKRLIATVHTLLRNFNHATTS